MIFKSPGIDLINIGLLLIAWILAMVVPFQLFLLAYAFIGPLHYLTEINWLHKKSYFIGNKKWIIWPILLAMVFGIPYILSLPVIANAEYISDSLVSKSFTWINGSIWMALLIALSLVITTSLRSRLGILVVGIVTMFVIRSLPVYNLWIGLLLPTLIHVYFFTLLFMVQGALRSQSKAGYIAFMIMLTVPFLIWWMPVTIHDQWLTDGMKSTFIQNKFHILNATVCKMLGLSDGSEFYFFETKYYKIQIFIAFAYFYHYLNWFSKTTVIGWHRALNRQRVIYIFSAWLLFASLVLVNYQVGITLLLILSILHVFLEFPLNFISMKSIVSEVQKKLFNIRV